MRQGRGWLESNQEPRDPQGQRLLHVRLRAVAVPAEAGAALAWAPAPELAEVAQAARAAASRRQPPTAPG